MSSTILATLAVNAVDMNGYFSRTLLGELFFGVKEDIQVCPENMALVTQALVPFCIDMYEASASDTCVYTDPKDEDETLLNLLDTDCIAESRGNAIPWRYVSHEQAQNACSASGKRLPTASEWYKAALGTPDAELGWNEESCNVANNRADGVSNTGSGMRCVSDAGAYDMVGNVWEWVAETIEKGDWNGRVLPGTGFVSGVDVDGIAYTTESAKNEVFNNDRFWIDQNIHAGILRGGYFSSQSQSGVYATYVASPPTFTGTAVGFRCVATANQN